MIAMASHWPDGDECEAHASFELVDVSDRRPYREARNGKVGDDHRDTRDKGDGETDSADGVPGAFVDHVELHRCDPTSSYSYDGAYNMGIDGFQETRVG